MTAAIVETSMAAAEPHDDLAARVGAFLQAAKDSASGGITWQEFGALLVALLRLVVSALDTMPKLSGPEKKDVAVGAVAALFDLVASKAVPLPVSALWVLCRPSVRALILALASGAIDQLLPLVRSAK
jgi:hypothetical protein